MADQRDESGLGHSSFSAGGRRSSRPVAAGGTGDADHAEADPAEAHGRALILASVARDARLDRKYLLLITLSAAIATLGLLQSSTAVVIGAMLVSPLMGPIMGIGFGLATLDSVLVKRALVTLAAGMAVAVVVAVLLIWLSPIQDVTPELRARTQPTLLDLGVAVVGGVAGVYAIIRKLSGVMVGVAIATALVPPLSTVGFGLATGRGDFALGAALLFLTNTLAIALAATVVARISRFGPSLTPQHTMMQVAGIIGVLAVLSIPLALSLNDIVREIGARSVVQARLDALMGDGDRVDTLAVRMEDGRVLVDGVLLVNRYQPALNQQLAKSASARLERPVEVNLAQLRQQTSATNQAEDQFNRRLTVLESRDGDAKALLAGLTVGDLIDRDAISVDEQARRIFIARDRAEEGPQVAEAVDRVIARMQSDFPRWVLRSIPRADTDGAGEGAAGPVTAAPAR